MTSVGRHAGGTWMFVVFPDGSLLIEILILCVCVDLGLILNENCLADVRAENAVGFEDDITNEGDMTPLQKHVSFFDRNKDGLIYPTETYQGFRAIGCGMTLSSISAIFINGFLGPKTRPGKFPSLLFPIYVKNINKGKHGSDSGVYDTEGRFVPAKFEEIFEKHALTNADGLTSEELMGMLKSNREPKDHKGWFASWTEWKILYYLCKDKNGMLHKDTIRSVYDGSLFLKMEEDRASAKAKQL